MVIDPGTPGFVCFRRGEQDWRSLARGRDEWADPARRARYLLRDVEQPISFDQDVLPYADEGERSAIELVAAVFATPAILLGRTALGMGEPLDELPGGEAGWALLGFDVGDVLGCSGLMNCGYSDNKESLAATWRDRLNRHHLLVDVDAANEFRAMTELRVPEHAPFFVYGIFCRGSVPT